MKEFVIDRSSPATSFSIKPPSPLLLALYHLGIRVRMSWHFRSLRIANLERFPAPDATRPLIVFLNHVSWWDPVPSMILHHRMRPYSDAYSPTDAMGLRAVPYLRYLGFFPVDAGTIHGAKQFLHGCQEILARPNAVLWITPEGKFTDPRLRPLELKRGLATLLTYLDAVTLVPLAIEYPFWDGLRPDILASWGEPIQIDNGTEKTVSEWHEILTASLTQTQDELANLVIQREADKFRTLHFGHMGPRNALRLLRSLKPLFQRQREIST